MCIAKQWQAVGYSFLLWGLIDRPPMMIAGGIAIFIAYILEI